MHTGNLIVLSGIVGLIAIGCGKKEAAVEPVPRQVKMITIGSGGLGVERSYSGRIESANQVDLSFEIDGKIIALPVNEGDKVSKGQLLIQIDQRDVIAQLNSAKAQLNAKRADYDRNRTLYEENTISRRQLDESRRAFEVAQADVDGMSKKVSDATIRAPFAGTIAKKYVDNFQSVNAKTVVLTLVDNESLVAKVELPERDLVKTDRSKIAETIEKIKPTVEIASIPGRFFPARFKELAAMADTVTRTYTLSLSFDNPKDVNILSGMSARVSFTPDSASMNRGSIISIPASAILKEGAKISVWKVRVQDSTVSQVSISVGALDGDMIEVTAGLSSGDIIATSGVHYLQKGQKVRPFVAKEK